MDLAASSFSRVRGFGLLLYFLLVCTGLAWAQPAVIEEVRVRGNRRIPLEDILFYIQTKKGDPYDENRLRMDWSAINRTNIFEQVELDVEDGLTGKIVTFLVKEKPLIRSIKYEGNKSFTESDILEHFKQRKVGLTVDSQYDPGRIKAAERAIKELLEKNGKPLGTVRAEREDIPPASVAVKFVITEGEKVRVGQITFSGSKVFDDDKVRKSMKLVRERNMITIFTGKDKYARLMLEADLEQNVKKMYQENGYVKVAFGEPKVEIKEGPRGFIPMFRKTKRQFFIDIPVDAGPQYKVAELKIEGGSIKQGEKQAITDEQAAKFFGLNAGDVVNFTKIRDGMEALRKYYHGMGYIAVEMLPNQRVDEDKKLFYLTFSITPGDQYKVHQINFSGNTKTRDVVLRREFILIEGEPYSGYAMDLSVLRLNQLGFFDKIEEKDYDVTPNDRTKEVDVMVRVKEKSQQSIGLTGGVSGISGSFIGLNYSSNNFLGKGQKLEVDITGGTRTTNFVVSFTEPYFRGTRWSTGVSVFSQKLRFDTYTTFGLLGSTNGSPAQLFTRNSTGITLSASYPIKNFWRLGASYTFQNIRITDIAQGFETFALGQLVGFTPGGDPKQAGKGILRSEFTPTITYNTTNSYFNPTHGQNLVLSFGLTGGPLGGDFNLVHPSLEYRFFTPDRWITRGRNTLAFHFLGSFVTGFNGTPVPFFDRFFIGGETTIRGFDIRSIFPLALSRTPRFDANGVPIIDVTNSGLQKIDFGPAAVGGDTLYMGNFEYRIPIAGPLSLSPFVDVGTTLVAKKNQLKIFGEGTSVTLIDQTNSVVRSSVGLELQFLLPVVQAPFRLIFAYNPNRLTQTVDFGNGPVPVNEPKKDIKFTIGRSF